MTKNCVWKRLQSRSLAFEWPTLLIQFVCKQVFPVVIVVVIVVFNLIFFFFLHIVNAILFIVFTIENRSFVLLLSCVEFYVLKSQQKSCFLSSLKNSLGDACYSNVANFFNFFFLLSVVVVFVVARYLLLKNLFTFYLFPDFCCYLLFCLLT